MSCTLLSSLKRDANGRVYYRGRWYQVDKPVNSTRFGKKKMVLAKKGKCVKLIHFGAEGYRHNYSKTARENYLRRSAGIRDGSGRLTKNDKHSANYWSRRVLWDAKK